MLEYEKNILKSSNEAATLTILAKGLPIENILKTLLKLYNNESSLVFLLNSTQRQLSFFNDSEIRLIKDITKLTTQARAKAFKEGGIFYGTSRVLISDFINNNVPISKISCIILLNAESIEIDSTENFILYLFKKFNSLGLIKAFSNSPLEINRKGLENVICSLKTNKILFYPRFHEEIQNSMKEIEITQISIKQPKILYEIVFLMVEILNKISNNIKNQNREKFDLMNILIYAQKNKNIRNFKRLLSLLFNADSLTSYIYYKKMLEEQKNPSESTFILLEQSHLLLDGLKEYLESDMLRSKTTSANFAFDLESGIFRINVDAENVVDEDNKKNFDCCDDDSHDSSDSEDGFGMHFDLFDASFYLINLKIKKIIEILEQDLNKQTAILTQNLTIKSFLVNGLKKLNLIKNVNVLTHSEIKYIDISHERIIFMNPDLASIRFFENLGISKTNFQIFIIQYSNSIEEERFLMEIRLEKESFETMIDQRSNLPLRTELEIIEMEEEDSEEHVYEVTIDSREMRSKLPFYLYKADNIINIKVLDIGDYLLGKNMCIERKAILDLIGSLNSGRLYQQAQKMAYNYQSPVLFLEFPDSIPCLIDYDGFKEFSNSIIGKFCLFMYNFPTFEILWSSSHVASVKLLRQIQKRNMEEEKLDFKIDVNLSEILLCIPGINSNCLNNIFKEFENIKDLSSSSIERLERVLDASSATKVFNFFRTEFKNLKF